MTLQDPCGRTISYLRVSITENCNFKCDYCRGPSDRNHARGAEFLDWTEMVRLVRLFVDLGVSRARITGGEPLLHPEFSELVGAIGVLPGLRDLSVSTNGALLGRHARFLKEMGVERVNISLDTLDPASFSRITRGGDLDRVLEGIQAAIAAGMETIKINMVVMAGVNDHEIPDILAYAQRNRLVLRFIETMPIGPQGHSAVQRFMSAEQILERVRDAAGCDVTPVRTLHGFGPARYFCVTATGLDVGVISAMSQHFCETCNRVRLTSRGELVLCLGRENRVDLKTPLRAGAGDEDLRGLITEAIARKPVSHAFSVATDGGVSHAMSALGG